MANGNFHAIFDPLVYQQFMRIVGKGNVTHEIEKYMQNVIAINDKDLDSINIQLVNMEIDILQQEISKKQADLTRKVQIKEKYETIKQENEARKLQAEKDRIEKAKRCIACNNILDNKESIAFPKGTVCKACYLVATREMIVDWN